MSSMLRLENVEAGYGSAAVLHGVNIEVEQGEIAVILGANGVGKTTTLRAITGLIRPWRGTVEFEGRRLGRMRPEEVVRLGIGVVPESPGVFRDMSVKDNLRVGGFALGPDRAAVESRLREVLDFFPLLAERQSQLAGSLSGGEQRTLAVARALMGSPRLLLVDEASMGLSPTMVAMVFHLMDRIRNQGVTVCMVEQNVSALDVADRAYVMEKGRVVHEARGRELGQMRSEVASAYLGPAAAKTARGGR